MTEYRVVFYRTEYTEKTVEADNWEDALDKAYGQVEGDWELDSVEEV